MTRDDYIRLAAPAPIDDDDEGPDAAELLRQPDMHALCQAWSDWCRTRRMYVRPSLPPSLLGRLTSKGSGRSPDGGPDAIASAHLMAFHIAFLAQPDDALDRRVIELHYYRRVRNIKQAAQAVGISRQHWYRLVGDCRARIYRLSAQILQRNLLARDELPHAGQPAAGAQSVT
jgi:hypothetical protein